MYNEEVEKEILHYIIFLNEQFELNENDFVNTTHKRIIKAINKLKKSKQEISLVNLSDELKDMKNIVPYLGGLGDNIYRYEPDKCYAILKKYTQKRELTLIARSIQRELQNSENMDILIERIIKKLKEVENQTQKSNALQDQIMDVVDIIEQNINKKDDYSYYTNLFELDHMTDGLHEGELTVIGARPGVGKTTFALQIAEEIASRGKKVTYISLEMSAEQIIYKLLAKRGKISSKKIRNGNLTDEQLIMLNEQANELNNLSLSIITNTNTIQQIEIEARRRKNGSGLDLLIIDYLQLLKNNENFKSREQEVADMSRTLKLLSLELNIPIIALCQLNRNATKNEPTLADIRESGAIEQDADNVIFLYHSEKDEEDIITVDLQKQRAGDTGTCKLCFLKNFSTFVNIMR